ncbi:hypothetical protein KSP39_PZI004829 [Platanthera zijinensis]|uniref:Uncharacterized protein n=1 Tax=Platanthera zijinensis TaxID=2320716 RepID=A0AAP0GCB8_9ASPA
MEIAHPPSTSLLPLLLLLLLAVISFTAVKTTADNHRHRHRRRLIDEIIHSAALHSHPCHQKTAVPYSIPLQYFNLSSAAADSVRFRAGCLRRRGAVINEFRLSSGLVAHPHVKRLLFILQNLGNLSASLYSVPGYKLVSPVLGLLVYDAAGTNAAAELHLSVTKKPIEVDFSKVAGVEDRKEEAVCALFGLGGRVEIAGRSGAGGVCFAKEQGHFGLVVKGGGDGGMRRWKVVAATAALGAVGVALLGVLVMAVVRGKRKERRMSEMERRANEDEALRVSMVGNMRTYTATAVRTAPEMENEGDGLNM